MLNYSLQLFFFIFIVAVLAITILVNLSSLSFPILLLKFPPSSTGGCSSFTRDFDDISLIELLSPTIVCCTLVLFAAAFPFAASNMAFAVCRATFRYSDRLLPLPSSDNARTSLLLFRVRTSSCALPPSR